MVECKRIATLGQFKNELIVNPLGGIVLSEFGAEAASLDSHHRIYMGIEVLLASEDLRCDLILLRRGSGMLQGLSCQIAEELAKRLRSMQGMAAEKFFDLFK